MIFAGIALSRYYETFMANLWSADEALDVSGAKDKKKRGNDPSYPFKAEVRYAATVSPGRAESTS